MQSWNKLWRATSSNEKAFLWTSTRRFGIPKVSSSLAPSSSWAVVGRAMTFSKVVQQQPQPWHKYRILSSSLYNNDRYPPWNYYHHRHHQDRVSSSCCGFHTSTRSWKASLATDAVNDSSTTATTSTGMPPNNGNDYDNPMPDFDNTRNAYAPMTTKALYRAIVTLQVCRLRALVNYSEFLLWLTRRTFGNVATDALLKATLFGHFCGGTDRENIKPRIRLLEQQGVGSILDYAAEDDGEEHKYSFQRLFDYFKGAKSAPDELPVANTASTENKVRIYDYESEAKCNEHMENFSKCIVDAAALGKDGYAAMKVTALGPPALLEMMSTAIVEARKLFAKFDSDGNGLITAREFEEQYSKYFHTDTQKIQELKEQLRCPDTGYFDYIAWSLTLSPRDLPRITSACRERGPLSMATPTEEELKLMDNMFHRAHALAKTAADNGVRLLIDAEQVRFQPAIDNLVWELQTTYNSTETTDIPLIYGTYQCYLKDALDRLKEDVERSERYNFHLGAKLVRGAYMEHERELAEKEGLPSPIHDDLESTHASYNKAVDFLLQHASIDNGKHTEVMLATHNRESIEKAIVAMNKYGIDRRATSICFGQLYGMADNLSFNLGKHGYRAYKYVPYGEVKMVIAYLIRRALENSSVSKGARQELSMLHAELWRRRFGLSA